MSDEKYTTEGYRWIVLLLFMFISIMNQMNWITFAPMMNDVAVIYDVSPDLILYLLTASFMIVYVFMNYPATWAIDKYGLKWGTGIGVILTGVFGLLRAFAPNFTMLAIAQIMIGVGQPFLLNSFTKVAINWFSEAEKATATGIGTIAVLIGIVLGMFVSPMLFYDQGLDYLLMLYGILSFIAMVLYLAFVRDQPKQPANQFVGKVAFDYSGMKSLFKNRSFNLLLIILFAGLGAFNAITSEVDILFSKFDDPEAPGIIGGTIIVGGIFGAAILSVLSDMLHKRKIFLIIATSSATVLSLFLTSLDSYTLTLVVAFVFGFLLVSALPIALVYAAELTFPVSEEASNGLLMTLGQVGGLILLAFFDMYLITAVFAIGFIASLFLVEEKAQEKVAD
jgi:MFS family permease